MADVYPYEPRSPLAPYRFEWAAEPAVDRQTNRPGVHRRAIYTHADGSVVIIRNYSADGSFQIMTDRGEIELLDYARDYRSPRPVSVVKLP